MRIGFAFIPLRNALSAYSRMISSLELHTRALEM